MKLHNKKRLAWTLMGIVLLAGLILVAGPAVVVERLININIGTFMCVAGLLVITTLLGALNVYLLMGHDINTPFRGFVPLYWLGWAVGLVFPGQVGDVAMLAWVLKRKGVRVSLTIGNSLLDKLISLAVIACFAIVGLALSMKHIIFESWIFIGVIFCFFIIWLVGIRGDFVNRWPWFASNQLFMGVVFALHQARTTAINNLGLVIANLCLTIVKVVLTGTTYWLVFAGLGETGQPLLTITSVAMAAGIVSYLPLSLNGVGTVEVTGVLLFGMLGITATAVVAAYLTLRLTVLAVAWLPASIWLLFVYLPRHKGAAS